MKWHVCTQMNTLSGRDRKSGALFALQWGNDLPEWLRTAFTIDDLLAGRYAPPLDGWVVGWLNDLSVAATSRWPCYSFLPFAYQWRWLLFCFRARTLHGRFYVGQRNSSTLRSLFDFSPISWVAYSIDCQFRPLWKISSSK